LGLTKSSTGSKIMKQDIFEKANNCDYTIAIAGNPNVGKSTIFNNLTGMHQHTGNWPGKTVTNATGVCNYKSKNFLLVDIPGTYSLMSNSEEEEIARNYICFGNPDVTVVIIDATCLERNLNLVYQTMEITSNIVVCVNLLDEAKKKGIEIDLKALSKFLGVPVVGTVARKKKTLENLLNTIYKVCTLEIIPKSKLVTYPDSIEDGISKLLPHVLKLLPENYKYIARWICIKIIDGEPNILNSINSYFSKNFMTKAIQENLNSINIDTTKFKDYLVSSIISQAESVASDVCVFKILNYKERNRKIDKILTSKTFGIPIMLIFLGLIFWITITGANYPSRLLSNLFCMFQNKLLIFFNNINFPWWLTDVLVNRCFSNFSLGC